MTIEVAYPCVRGSLEPRAMTARQIWTIAEQVADSDEGAQAFRFDGALGSDMMSPRWWSLAGW